MEASLRGYLTEIDSRASTGHGAAELARVEMPRVVAALRALLDDHQPDPDGRCPSCRTRWFTRAPAPCRAYLTTHLCLLSAEEEVEDSTEPGATATTAYPRHLANPSVA
ncbi:hypothetical protein ACOBQX_27985 [Actinokineospora sp. G85]|uniref:hypothetical protein n=1 Tax=Actinokineospora sp. G85 TaxID=3406626 RepID=UPI003C75261B